MKLLLVVLLAQHAVISARAGLVTFVRGVGAEVDEHMGEGNPIRTGPGGRFEAMLGPDSYVRTRGRAAIVLESEALDHTVLRMLDGSAIVETRNIDKDMPILVLLNDLEITIGKDGLYLFQQDRVAVLDGEIHFADATGRLEDTRLRKGWAIVRAGPEEPFTALQLENSDDLDALPLVRWSRQRTERLTPEPVFRRARPGIGRRFRF